MTSKVKFFIKVLFPFRFYTEKILFYHRLGRLFLKRRIPLLPAFCESRIYYRFSCMISNKANIGANLKLPHPVGIIIGEGVTVGNNVTIYQNVTIGRKIKMDGRYPRIADGVTIYCNSVVLGDIIIDESTVIGANSLVLDSTESRSIYAGSPAKRVK